MKDYTTLFFSMYNIANHVCKNYNQLLSTDIGELEYNNIAFRFLIKRTARIMLGNANEGVCFSVWKHNVELETKRLVHIKYFDPAGKAQKLSFVKHFNEDDHDNLYVHSTEFGRIDYPLSTDDVFHLNLSTFPITMKPETYNKIMRMLDESTYSISFSMDSYDAF